MKKIFVFLSLSYMLTTVSVISKLWAEESIPIFEGDIKKVVARTIYEGSDYLVVVVEGKTYIVKLQK